jgi:UDP-2,3-diacylglucosamine pyrophosphatase LpxH
MLVLVSDLHISDTTTAHNVNPEAIGLLAADMLETAGRRGAHEIHLVLLGDIFDLVRTDYWHRHGIPMVERPWGGTLDPRTAMNARTELVEAQFSHVLAAILATDLAGELARHLGEIAERAPLTVTYVLGNHERVLWNFPSLRRQISAAIPQIHRFAAKIESAEYGVLARHGHEWDEHTHGWRLRREVLTPGSEAGRFDDETYRVMAIGEAVTAELMGGLIYHAGTLGASPAVVDQLKEVNNLRPMLDVFAWLEWLGGTKSGRDREILHRALQEALDGVLDTSLAKLWDRLTADVLVSGDLVDRLQQARSLLLGSGFDTFEGRVEALKTAQRLFPFLSPTTDSLVEGAGEEEVLKLPRAGPIQRVIYGHTHRARHDYFSADQAGAVKMYVNTGTFLPLIERARDRRSFVNSIQMTMVYVYRADEDTERKAPNTTSLDIWNGIRRKQYI